MRPGKTPMLPNQPAPPAGSSRRRPDLRLPILQRDPTALAVPLPLPPPSTSWSGSGPPSSGSSSSSGSGSGSGSVSVSGSSASATPPTAPVFAQPQIIPALADLERVRRVGSGSGGSVWMVRHRPTGRIYALKNIYGHHDDVVRRQICREIEILRTADSPFVVRCHGMYDQGGEIQILLEYMDVGSLNGRRITSETVLADVARQVLSGLHYLHRRRIVHRDIKPANLLINAAGHVKIADFGVSRILAQTMDPTCNSSVGTIAYMSPERINTELNHGAYDGYAGDIWSFGISILEFYLGHFPFGENLGRQGDWASLMLAICYANPPEAPPTVSREFRSFIACCLQKEPGRRLTAQKLLQHPFVAQSSPSSLQPPNSSSTHHP